MFSDYYVARIISLLDLDFVISGNRLSKPLNASKVNHSTVMKALSKTNQKAFIFLYFKQKEVLVGVRGGGGGYSHQSQPCLTDVVKNEIFEPYERPVRPRGVVWYNL